MLVTNFKVFITKNGDGAITYTKNNVNYRVYISKKNEVLFEIFYKYYKQIKPFKNRHYAIAQWIAKDIRMKGYVFKAYCNNNRNIRPILSNKDNLFNQKDIFLLKINGKIE